MPHLAHITSHENASVNVALGFSNGLNPDGRPLYRSGVWLEPVSAPKAGPNQVVVLVDLDLECYRLFDRTSLISGFLLPVTLVNERAWNVTLDQPSDATSSEIAIED